MKMRMAKRTKRNVAFSQK
uniref:Uncharacterized protein n=1 Tax=Glossina morsitans morsitans TaxID=37546 RepID=A0A1B0FLP6_GLOMM